MGKSSYRSLYWIAWFLLFMALIAALADIVTALVTALLAGVFFSIPIAIKKGCITPEVRSTRTIAAYFFMAAFFLMTAWTNYGRYDTPSYTILLFLFISAIFAANAVRLIRSRP